MAFGHVAGGVWYLSVEMTLLYHWEHGLHDFQTGRHFSVMYKLIAA